MHYIFEPVDLQENVLFDGFKRVASKLMFQNLNRLSKPEYKLFNSRFLSELLVEDPRFREENALVPQVCDFIDFDAVRSFIQAASFTYRQFGAGQRMIGIEERRQWLSQIRITSERTGRLCTAMSTACRAEPARRRSRSCRTVLRASSRAKRASNEEALMRASVPSGCPGVAAKARRNPVGPEDGSASKKASRRI